MKVKKGDQVKVLSGKDRGKLGKVLHVYPQKEQVVVDGVNLVKKHKKSNRRGVKGERIVMPAPINISNIQIVCPKCSKPARIGSKKIESGKTRICKKCGAEL